MNPFVVKIFKNSYLNLNSTVAAKRTVIFIGSLPVSGMKIELCLITYECSY